MKMNSSKMLFYITMSMGILMTISSNNWIMVWCGLEMSLISFIPLMINKLLISSESTMKYFIVQSISSSMLMLSMLIMIMKGDYNYDYMLTTSLLVKMGVAPFHNWVLTVIEGLDLFVMIILLTMNKVAPITLLSYLMKSTMIIIFMTMLIGAMLGLNQNSIKKLIGYSSIFNMGMILSVIKLNFMWMLYIAVYSILLLMLFVIIKTMKVNFVNQMVFSEMLSNKMLLWITMLSMGGVPPLMGFSIKYLVMLYMIKMKFFTMIIFMVMVSLMTMFFYLRMMFMSIMNNSMMSKIKLFNLNELSTGLMMINLMSMPVMLMVKTYMV
uniref:NADH-ubiquinone oxidoreductase chain 2 n=1 Tax=Vatana ogromna TaxID=2893153 RepID=A0A9E6XQ85_9HEMI|nr:NADH dehydrogenase subunit 2 [Vatana ogromna]UGN61407.1 NADH dehydrogenase subunit 2 [Vatana ogromna]